MLLRTTTRFLLSTTVCDLPVASLGTLSSTITIFFAESNIRLVVRCCCRVDGRTPNDLATRAHRTARDKMGGKKNFNQKLTNITWIKFMFVDVKVKRRQTATHQNWKLFPNAVRSKAANSFAQLCACVWPYVWHANIFYIYLLNSLFIWPQRTWRADPWTWKFLWFSYSVSQQPTLLKSKEMLLCCIRVGLGFVRLWPFR